MVRIEVKKLESFLERNQGLMFTDSIRPVYFETRFGIHTFFVRQKLDIVILDSMGKVQVLKEGLCSNRVFFWNMKYKRIIEMPMGQIDALKLEIGTQITISFV